LDVLLFNVIELCFEQALISLDVLLMFPQTVISLGHSLTQKYLSGKLSPASIAAILDNLQERYPKSFFGFALMGLGGIKYDGYRLRVERNGNCVHLITRNGQRCG
jgi:ATP-dependent DNA ligase